MNQSRRSMPATLVTALWALPLLYGCAITVAGLLSGQFDFADASTGSFIGYALAALMFPLFSLVTAAYVPMRVKLYTVIWLPFLWLVAGVVSLQSMREWMHLGGHKLFDERFATDLGSAAQFILIAVPVIAIGLRLAPQTEIESRLSALMERHIVWKYVAWLVLLGVVAVCVWAIGRGSEAAVLNY